MTSFLLIRHAMCDHVGSGIAGRTDVHLNELGRAQARRLAEQLDPVGFDALISSPLARATETAAPLAERRRLELQIEDRLTEIDYGDWTGQSIDALKPQEQWTRYNALRSVAAIPNGELMLEVQARAVSAIEAMRRSYPDGRFALVSHGDVIRSLVAHCAGIPLDLFHRLEIAPASVSEVIVSTSWIGVRSVNVPLEGTGGLS
ncbi:MAG: histidine phosphatase family protein [Gemmatimonadaceae bacterium]